MKYTPALTFAVLVVGAASVLGQTNAFEMPMLATRLPAASFKLVNQIPRSHVAKLPRSLPIFRYSTKPHEFPSEGLQTLLDQSVFSGTNVSALLDEYSKAVSTAGTPIRLATARHLDYFFADGRGGAITYATHNNGVNLRLETPPYDAVPSFDAIRDTVLRYAATFGVNTNEMEHKDDGSLVLRKTDDKTVARGGQIKFISRRSVGVSRSVAGYALLISNDKVELTLGVKGRLLRFDLKWPIMEPVRTNRLFTIGQMTDNIKKGRVLADMMNQYPADGISEIILKDMRVFYYVPEARDFRSVSPSVDIVPIISFHAVFKSKTGKTEDGGIYTPLAEP